MDSSRQIEDAAAEWLQRRDDDEWSLAEQAKLDEWLDETIAHRVAYLRLEAAWEQTQRLQALGAGTQPGIVPPPGEWRVSPLFEQRQSSADRAGSTGKLTDATGSMPEPDSRSRARIVSIAASLLVALGIAYLLGTYSLAGGDHYSTAVGGMASIPLTDGSNITLNTESNIRIAITKDERLIKLQNGEAFFDVAKDPTRPFIVEAGGKRIIAVGTRFSVRRDGGDIQVIVTDGKVRVEGSTEDPHPPAVAGPSLSSHEERGDVLLGAGAIAHTADNRLVVERTTPQAAEQALSWRSGYLTFDSVSLADAVADFNRYTALKIQIRDPHLAGVRISGKFRTTNAEAFVRVLRDGFNIEAQQSDGRIVLSQR